MLKHTRNLTMKLLCFALLFSFLSSLINAATFTVRNQCPYTVWAAATPGGGTQLTSGQTWTFNVNPGTTAARVWGRTNCNFDGSGRGGCQTGDCNGFLQCQSSGQPPFTIAEYSLTNQDYYDISVIDGFNIPMDFSPTNGGCVHIRCPADRCPEAYLYPSDNTKTHACPSGNFNVVFCP